MTNEFPPLPVPSTSVEDGLGIASPVFDEQQMRDYVLSDRALRQAEPVAWHPTDAAITALKRFHETCSDGEGYDVPVDTMRILAVIGLVYKTHGNTYCITYFGNSILEAPQLCVPKTAESETQPDLSLTDATQTEQEPVMFISERQIPLIGKAPYFAHRKEAEGLFQYALYAAPQPAHVQPLTDEQIAGVRRLNELETISIEAFRCAARAIEAAHGIHPANQGATP